MDLRAQRILITGGHGFLGAAIHSQLAARQCAAMRFTRLEADLLKPADVATLFEKTDPTVVIHCAATVGGIGANLAEPGRFFYDNALMGIHVVEECRRRNVAKLVMIGTVCSYPERPIVPFREESLWSGYPEPTNAPYGIAKRALLVMGDAYRKQYGLNSVFVMPTNLYGPGDDFGPRTSHVIPALIRKFLEACDAGADSCEVWGDGSPTREFLYLADAARMIIDAAARYDSGRPLNLGSGEEISILELARVIADIVGFRGRLRFTGECNGQPRRCLDLTRAHAFGFIAQTRLHDGLARTVEWYKAERLRNCADVVNS